MTPFERMIAHLVAMVSGDPEIPYHKMQTSTQERTTVVIEAAIRRFSLVQSAFSNKTARDSGNGLANALGLRRACGFGLLVLDGVAAVFAQAANGCATYHTETI